MKITIINIKNLNYLTFLDEEEVNAIYGANKPSLTVEDFILNKHLTLIEVGGNGGLNGLPTKKADSYLKNFSQEYRYLSGTYDQREIEIAATIPPFITDEKSNTFKIINDVIGTDQELLTMIIDNRTSGGNLMYIPKVHCEESPLTRLSSNYKFLCFGDAEYTFREFPKGAMLDPRNKQEELVFPAKFPLTFLEKSANIYDIINETDKPWEIRIVFQGGTGTNPKVENLTTGGSVGYIGTVADGDKIIIDNLNRTITKNGVNVFTELSGEFWLVERGVNKIRFSLDTVSETNPVFAFIEYEPVYKNAF